MGRPCPSCAGGDVQPMRRYHRAYLVRCRRCRLIFSDNRPGRAELLRHYGQYSRGYQIEELTLQRYAELLDSWEAHRETGCVLDIGCGPGHFLEIARERGWRPFGTELEDAVI